MKEILVTCYVNPDLDGAASAIAYAEYLNAKDKSATAGIIGEPTKEAKYLLNRYVIDYLQLENSNDYEQIILVDASDLDGLAGKTKPEKVIEIIDHRQVNEAKEFVNAKLQIELVGAAATLIAEKFIKDKIEISKESAILLYGAIISNTLNFKGNVTTERDRQAAEWLKARVPLSEMFWRELFLSKSNFSSGELQMEIKVELANFFLGGRIVNISQIELIGAEQLIKDNEKSIIKVLQKIKNEKSSDFIFLSLIELEKGRNYFITDNQSTRKLLEKCFNVKFIGNIAERKGFIMRKEMVPIIKNELEK